MVQQLLDVGFDYYNLPLPLMVRIIGRIMWRMNLPSGIDHWKTPPTNCTRCVWTFIADEGETR